MLQVDDSDEHHFDVERVLSFCHKVEPIFLVRKRELVPFELPHLVEQTFVLRLHVSSHEAKDQQDEERLQKKSKSTVEAAGEEQNATRTENVCVEGDDHERQSSRKFVQPLALVLVFSVSLKKFVQCAMLCELFVGRSSFDR